MLPRRYDIVIIGGGIVGLATAMQAALRYPSLRLVVLEKENEVGTHQSGHNSGVIHSGLYYQPGSLKARLCREGAEAMLAFCRREGIPHEVCGKVVVATRESELAPLEELLRRGRANGVAGLEVIGRDRLKELEPLSDGLRAIRVPGTAITDYVAVTRRMASIAKKSGVEVRTGARVVGLALRGADLMVETTTGDLEARHAVNCSGLHSDRIARMAGADPGVIIVPFRGEYYELAAARRSMVRGLIYPVPDPSLPFLGVHLTRRINGGVEAGPNAVLALRREGYRRSSFRLEDAMETFAFSGFWKMARKYWRTGLGEMHRSMSRRAFLAALQRLAPGLRDEDLVPGGAGVRAQAMDRTGRLLDDFHIVEGEGMIHVLNVPSPAATASLAIGRRILEMMESSFDLFRAGGPAVHAGDVSVSKEGGHRE